jgi:ketosteroid isomerase-like protein
MRASAETMDVINGYYGLMDACDLAGCERFFTPDATMQIAHFPKLEGWPTIERVMGAGLANPNVKRLRHEVRNAWDEDDCSIFEVHAHYEMTDGRDVVVPGVVIAEICDGRFTSQRIAADLSPTFTP